MIPVLAVRDPQAASSQLRDMFGFRDTASGRLALGDQEILVAPASALPEALLAMPFDHLAMSVPDVAQTQALYGSRGARLDPDYTPDGPVDIPEFWENGVRFVFFSGPDEAPMEFCQKLGVDNGSGHSHYGMRVPDLDATEAALTALGAHRIAAHRLDGPPPISVRFLALGDKVFELFDAEPFAEDGLSEGWVGFVDAEA